MVRRSSDLVLGGWRADCAQQFGPALRRASPASSRRRLDARAKRGTVGCDAARLAPPNRSQSARAQLGALWLAQAVEQELPQRLEALELFHTQLGRGLHRVRVLELLDRVHQGADLGFGEPVFVVANPVYLRAMRRGPHLERERKVLDRRRFGLGFRQQFGSATGLAK